MNFMYLSRLLTSSFAKLELLIDKDIELETLYSLIRVTSSSILPSSFCCSLFMYNS